MDEAAASRTWTDTPLAMIPTPMFLNKKHDLFTSGASHMCLVHNSIFRGYNSIYNQAVHVGENEKADFIGYCLTWHKFLKAHADNEDNSLFPRTEKLLEDDTIFGTSHLEHDAFMPGVAKFQEYLATLESAQDFSGAKLHEIMESFQEKFESHMRAEVITIAQLSTHPRTPKEGSAEEKSTQTAFDSREGNAIMKAGVTDVVPFFLFNYDRDFEDGIWKDWPPIPAPVRLVLMSAGKVLHPGWWKFASCDIWRQRKELYARST